jgi:hypothetical protein
MKLNDANKVFIGATPVDKVYAGANLVWEIEAWGSNESMYLSSAVPAVNGADANTFTVGAAVVALVPGRITAIRYYRTSSMLTSRIVSLWANDGSVLYVSVNATGGVVGWNTVPITPVVFSVATAFRVTIGQSGTGASDGWGYTNAALVPATPHLRWDAGVYSDPVSSGGQDDYPNQITGSYHYFVDVVFQQAPP